MTTMLERMRAKVAERQKTFERDYSIYTHWSLKFGASSTLRFLPYTDTYTEMFYAEKVMLPMQFTDAEDPAKVVKFMAPCREMYTQGEKCPVLGPVRELYNEEKELRNAGSTKDADKLKKIAGFHWKKPTYYYQGFVTKSGMTEENEPENPIRVFPFNKQIHKMIYASVFEADEDSFDILPMGEFTVDDVQALLGDGDVDMDKFNGYNFILKKGQQGEYADWTTGSTWARSPTMLSEEQLAAIAEHGLWDLSKRLPDRPSEEQYAVLTEMMEVSIQRMQSGENGVWQKEWEEAGFKPFRQRGSDDAKGSKPTASTKPAAKADDDGDAATESSGTTSGASDALSRLKAARGKAKSEPTPEPEDDSPAEVAAAADVSDEPAAAETGVSDLAAKIKARVSSKTA